MSETWKGTVESEGAGEISVVSVSAIISKLCCPTYLPPVGACRIGARTSGRGGSVTLGIFDHAIKILTTSHTRSLFVYRVFCSPWRWKEDRVEQRNRHGYVFYLASDSATQLLLSVDDSLLRSQCTLDYYIPVRSII